MIKCELSRIVYCTIFYEYLQYSCAGCQDNIILLLLIVSCVREKWKNKSCRWLYHIILLLLQKLTIRIMMENEVHKPLRI